jgi:uncharacterized protein (TIGR00725 family)
MSMDKKYDEKTEKITDSYLRYKIAISGAAETGLCAPDAIERTETLGRIIAERGMILVTGATTGIPYWAAKGAKQAGGFVIGISPAATKRHHVHTYRLPTDYHDIIIYTGFGYSGRNLLFIRSADAVITSCGRIGTLNEFTDSFEDKKPQGVLTATGGTTDLIPEIIKKADRGSGNIVYESDPKALIDKLVALLDLEEKEIGD